MHQIRHNNFLEQLTGTFIDNLFLFTQGCSLSINDNGQWLLTKIKEFVAFLLIGKTKTTAKFRIIKLHLNLLSSSSGINLTVFFLFTDRISTFKLLALFCLQNIVVDLLQFREKFPQSLFRLFFL